MKLNVGLLRYLGRDEFRVMNAIEVGMRNHELVPSALVASSGSCQHPFSARTMAERIVEIQEGRQQTHTPPNRRTF